MDILTKQEECLITEQLVTEFLEFRLGYEATPARVKRLSAYLSAFEALEDEEC